MDNQRDSSIYPNGTIIADRYEITSYLAAGGMAQVYVATQKQINRPVALKVLSASFSMNQNVVMRFFREAHVVGALSHPNTVHIFDMGETPDHRLFIAMELLKGRELSERIKEGSMTFEESLPIVRQVAGSLSEAHQLGIIHRDLKPDNIFLTTLNVVKVLDFGIAKLKDDDEGDASERRLTKAGTAPGTPEYMSPEQARGKELDARSDLYSLGVVLYEMLCGHPPFEESTFLGTILMHVQSPPPPLPDNVPEIVRNYVVNRLLAKDPAGRPDNAEVFIKEIDEIARRLERGESEESSEEAEVLKARAEIEALKSQLAQSKMELEAERLERSVNAQDASSAMGVQTVPALHADSPDAGRPVSTSRSEENLRQMTVQGRARIPMPRGVRSHVSTSTTPSGEMPVVSGNATNAGAAHRNMVHQAVAYSNGADSSGAPVFQGRMPVMNMGNPSMMPQPMQPRMTQTGMPMMNMGNPQMMPRMTQAGMPAMNMGNPQMMSRMVQTEMPSMNMANPSMMSPQMMPQRMNPQMMPNAMHSSSESYPRMTAVTQPSRSSSDSSQLPYRRNPRSHEEDEEVSSGGGRPRDSFNGSATSQRTSTKQRQSATHEMTFMMYAQPLCNKLGPSKSSEALELARSIWNAVIMGDEAVDIILHSADGHANLTKLIELMVNRKSKFFADETWMINALEVKSDDAGRLDIRLG